MKDETAFVGDVHGNLTALRSLMESLEELELASVVLLGDYINKGPDGPAVIEYLLRFEGAARLIPLRGNHESAFLDCMDTGDVRPLLRMSGAPTVRAYVGGPVSADVYADLRASVPTEHVRFLAEMPAVYASKQVVAAHKPGGADSRFRVSAHVNVGDVPRVSSTSAEVDTGCGSPNGRLTAFLWPSRRYIQVDDAGEMIT
ncbi:metallophosphoesterase [Promicromonospora sp. Marseille-Q5078]